MAVTLGGWFWQIQPLSRPPFESTRHRRVAYLWRLLFSPPKAPMLPVYALLPLGLGLGLIAVTSTGKKSLESTRASQQPTKPADSTNLPETSFPSQRDTSPLPRGVSSHAPESPSRKDGASFGLNLGEDWMGFQVGKILADGRGQVLIGIDGSFLDLDSKETVTSSGREEILDEEVHISGARLWLGFESWTRTPSPLQLMVSSSLQASQGTIRSSSVYSLTETPSWVVNPQPKFNQSRLSNEVETKEFGLVVGLGVRVPSGISSLSLNAKVESGVAIRFLEDTKGDFRASDTRKLAPAWTVGAQWGL